VGPIAQSVEQRTFNPWVDGSSPSGPTQANPSELNSANQSGEKQPCWARFLSEVQLEIFLGPLSLKIREGGRLSASVLFEGHLSYHNTERSEQLRDR
jgi:hypothetical protein